MSMVCKLNESCHTSKGMCIHEKIMAGMAMVAAVVGIAVLILV